ncbi:MAG: hypothetical protein DIU69_01430 [Bacillota bacterium]|nr:MAG: hypothetical protein DIU69_01430 [Bacillota bacterium]
MEPLLRERIEAANLTLGKWLVVAICEVFRSGQGGEPPDHAEVVAGLRNAIPLATRGIVSAGVGRLACSGRGRFIKLIITGPSVESLRSACDRLAPVVHRIATTLGPGTYVRMGVSRPRENLAELSTALREAVAVVRFQASSQRVQPIHFDEVRLGRYLLMIPPPLLRQLVQDELGSLAALPKRDQDELLRTLSALLAENFNVSAAAKRLHLRRQSLYRRIERLKTLLGPDMDQCDRRAALLLALRARELLGVDAFGAH